MKRLLVSVTIAGSLIGLSLSDAWAADRRGPAPVVESIPVESFESSTLGPQFSAWKKQVDAKLARMERINSNRALMSLVRQIDQLTNEVNQLRGQVEELDYQLKKLSDRQKKIYQSQDQHLAALDKRMTTLEKQPVASAASTAIPTSAAVPLTSTTPQITPPSKSENPSTTSPINQERNSTPEEKLSYQAAFKLVFDGKYEEGITALEDFLKKYPNGPFSDNALYWIGEANYATGRYATALRSFSDLIKHYPESNKTPGAVLKSGFCYYELKQWDQAKNQLLHFINTYPTHKSIGLAKKRLQILNAEGH